MAEHSTSARYFVISLAALAVIVGSYVVVQHHRAQPPVMAQQPMTLAEKSYLSEIQVTDPSVSAASNFLGNRLYYLDVQLVNKGSQPVRALDLSLSFMDPFGEVLLVRTEHPVTRQTAPLKPGETRHVQFIFEHLPDTWNQGPPVIKQAYVSFR